MMRNLNRKKNRYQILAAAILCVLSVVITWNFCNSYVMSIINNSMFFFLAAAGMTVMAGYGGILSMCSIAFMGLAGFVCALFAKQFLWPTPLAVLMGFLAGTVFAVFIGSLLLKLEGAYFIFGTLGVVYISYTFFNNYAPLTGANTGIAQVPNLRIFGFTFSNYYTWFILLLALGVIVILITLQIKNSYLGRSLMAVKGDPVAATSLGINVYRTKLIGFTIGSSYAALAGALYCLHYNAISYAAFSSSVQLKLVIMSMLGGIQNVFGALIGAFVVNALPEVLRSVQGFVNLLYGAILVLLMIFMPQGLVGVFQKFFAWIKNLSRKEREGHGPVGS